MDIHKQAIEKVSASKIRKQRALRLCLHIVAYLTSTLHIAFSCILEFTGKSHGSLFKFNYYWQLLLFKVIQNAVRTFLRFWRRMSPEDCERECKCQQCYCIICIVQEVHARIKRWVGFVILQSKKIFLTWEKLNKGCRFSEVSTIESREQTTRKKTFIIHYKQRPFRFDESRRN